MTYLTGRTAEPEQAGALVSKALNVGAKLHSQIVASRAKDFVTSSSPWAHVPEIAQVAEAVAAWRVPSA